MVPRCCDIVSNIGDVDVPAVTKELHSLLHLTLLNAAVKKGQISERLLGIEYMGRGISANSVTILQVSPPSATETGLTQYFKALRLILCL